MSRWRGALAAAILLANVVGVAPVVAQQKRDTAAAEALFKKALKLSDRGKKKEACPIFDESYLLDPAPGTLLNIAECHRVDGKTATAWGEFIEAAREFRRRNDERRATFADEQADKLKPQLAYVRFIMTDPPEGLSWSRAGVSSSRGSLGEQLPIDPGPHTVTIKAEGYKSVDVPFKALPKELVDVTFPALELEPVAPAAVAPAESSSDQTQLLAGFVVGGVGIATGIVGLAMVGMTASASEDLDVSCPTKVDCDQALVDDAFLYANLANGFLIAGAALFATGLVVVLTAPSDASAPDPVSAEPTVWLEPRLGGASVRMRF